MIDLATALFQTTILIGIGINRICTNFVNEKYTGPNILPCILPKSWVTLHVLLFVILLYLITVKVIGVCI